MGRPSAMANRPTSTFDAAGLHVFAPLQLQDADSISSATHELNTAVMQHGMTAVIEAGLHRLAPGSHLERNTKDLYALPFIISVCSTQAVDQLAKDALKIFPRTLATWTATGIGWRLLLVLLKAAFFLPVEPSTTRLYPSLSSTDHKHALRHMAHFIHVSSRFLQSVAVDNIAQHGCSGAPRMLILDYCTPVIPPSGHACVYQQRRRRGREYERIKQLVEEWWTVWEATHGDNFLSAYDELGVARPLSRTATLGLCKAVLLVCCHVLEELLAYFRRDTVRDAIEQAYTSQTDADALDAHVLAFDNSSVYSMQHTERSTTSPSLCALPARLDTDFPFDEMEGFGPWRILVEHEARKALREADGTFYRVHLTKLQELSNGYLYGDNMKRLKRHDNLLIPQFEANTKNSRIVFQVHVVPDEDGRHEHQVIRIWYISNHGQIDRRHGLWSSIAHQEQLNERLYGTGRDGHLRRRQYQQRCAARTALEGRSTRVAIRPTVWPLGITDERQ